MKNLLHTILGIFLTENYISPEWIVLALENSLYSTEYINNELCLL